MRRKSTRKRSFKQYSDDVNLGIESYEFVPPIRVSFAGDIKEDQPVDPNKPLIARRMMYPYVDEDGDIIFEFETNLKAHRIQKEFDQVVTNQQRWKKIAVFIDDYLNKLTIEYRNQLVAALNKYRTRIPQLQSETAEMLKFAEGDICYFPKSTAQQSHIVLIDKVDRDEAKQGLTFERQNARVYHIEHIPDETDPGKVEPGLSLLVNHGGWLSQKELELLVPSQQHQTIGDGAARFLALAHLHQRRATRFEAKYQNQINLHLDTVDTWLASMVHQLKSSMVLGSVGRFRSAKVDMSEQQFDAIFKRLLKKEWNVEGWKRNKYSSVKYLNRTEMSSLFDAPVLQVRDEHHRVVYKSDRPKFEYHHSEMVDQRVGKLRLQIWIYSDNGTIQRGVWSEKQARLKRLRARKRRNSL